jgi:hypothetical protein
MWNVEWNRLDDRFDLLDRYLTRQEDGLDTYDGWVEVLLGFQLDLLFSNVFFCSVDVVSFTL